MSEDFDQEKHEEGLARTFIVCGVVIEKDEKFLLVQEKQPKAYKKWNLPAGKVDRGETLEQAAIREAKEETGFDVELKRHLIVVHQRIEGPVLHAFEAEITDGELNFPEDELLDAKWFTFEEIVELDLRNEDYILGAIKAVRDN